MTRSAQNNIAMNTCLRNDWGHAFHAITGVTVINPAHHRLLAVSQSLPLQSVSAAEMRMAPAHSNMVMIFCIILLLVLGVHTDGYRAVVEEFYLHVCPKFACAYRLPDSF